MADTPTATTDDDVPPWAAGTAERMHELNPELNEDQIAIVCGYGEERVFEDGDWLWRAGERDTGFFLVLDGILQIVTARDGDEHIIIEHGRGHYGGETATMAGRGALVGGRARGRTMVIALTGQRLRELIAVEAELGETLLLSFILRRMRMIAERQGDVTLTGIAEESATAALRTFLSRHGVPFAFVEGEPGEPPVVTMGETRLEAPTVREVAEALGLAADIKPGQRFDVGVIGAGPAGLAAAVYAASEGLSVVVVEASAPGGQAGTSSRIENYLGFPTGISGQGLAGRAWLQAQKFGAEIAVARTLERFDCGTPHAFHLDGGDTVEVGAVIIASGAVYREPPVKNLDAFTGGGVHYGASYIEAQLCRGRDVAIIGGGNSAGQAAVFLSRHARRVLILIRGESLASSMSRYLIDRIERTANIEVMNHTTVACANGDRTLASLTLEDSRTGETRALDVTQLFVFIGAVPATDFVPDAVALDDKGFVLTGDGLDDFTLGSMDWPERERRPWHLETSCPGVFAVGDVRAGSVKRVASAVGEGSVAIQFVHRWLEAASAS